MFTGIIAHTGKFKKAENQKFVFTAEESFCKKLREGDSIAVNGVCLTVCKTPEQNSFSVAIMPETIKRTMLGSLQKNELVNLELPATPESFLSGHIVLGHIDGTGTIQDISSEGNSNVLKITTPQNLAKYVVKRGSIAVNGISLTVIKAEKTYFTLGIIPYTWANTMLKQIKIGDTVNIETDIIAKYIERLLNC